MKGNKTRKAKFRVGQRVNDRGWPHRAGAVSLVGKTFLRVKWDDGHEEHYDRQDLKFLKREKVCPKPPVVGKEPEQYG